MQTRSTRRNHRRTALTAIALTATLVLGAASCGGGDEPDTIDDPTTTTTSSTSTTVKPEELPEGHFIELKLPAGLTAEEKEVAEAYRDALEAFARAQANPGAGAKALQEHVQGSALTDAKDLLATYVSDEQAARLADRSGVVVIDEVRIEGRTALVGSCLHDRLELYEVSTGETTSPPVADADSVTELISQGGTWKVSTAAPGEERAPGKPCAG